MSKKASTKPKLVVDIIVRRSVEDRNVVLVRWQPADQHASATETWEPQSRVNRTAAWSLFVQAEKLAGAFHGGRGEGKGKGNNNKDGKGQGNEKGGKGRGRGRGKANVSTATPTAITTVTSNSSLTASPPSTSRKRSHGDSTSNARAPQVTLHASLRLTCTCRPIRSL